MQGQFGAVQAHIQVITLAAFQEHALLEAGDDVRIHAAMMIASYVGNAFAHAIRQANDEFVSGTAGVESLFHRAHTINRLVQEGDTGNELFDSHRFDHL